MADVTLRAYEFLDSLQPQLAASAPPPDVALRRLATVSGREPPQGEGR